MEADETERQEEDMNTESAASDAGAGDELRVAQARCEELNDKYLRLAADFENYKKRTARETEQIIRFANERLALEFLEILDNLERALKAEDADLKEGLSQIHKLFLSILERNGITPIKCTNARFNPNEHEAIAHIPSDYEEGYIIDEVCRGYCMHDKVIRCAKVAVSKGKQNNE
ncbi:nucleotide exchange factor GrpE [Methanocalculus taiwanensis]|uniref:Protein GrpE n=1 Tax=Methanocalculus taiwanensis TaxID=106207 RepID=A0ABD4THU6_9EURY|nr:nucleotide exchange factor GrpE [Methanocalculus taiwanensis]MCQ1537872.1 nucleotide exchange factor GrpE [Methanocalculus taiwanensis]